MGFEHSEACHALLAVLTHRTYTYQQFALSPTQLGIPNERPRYYLLAARRREVGTAFLEKHYTHQELSPTSILSTVPACFVGTKKSIGQFLDKTVASVSKSQLLIRNTSYSVLYNL